ncbi:MAG TPA: hypothetical protein VK187_01605 [Geobacteraceae bacterium]|nr:hypothetical protein [Geobacteraceae bacterium]
MKKRKLPDINACRTRKLSTGQLECRVKTPVSCCHVRVGNEAYFCEFAAKVDDDDKNG